MSREIKFRAWDKKHRKYTKVLKVYFGSGGSNLGALVEDYETNYAFELQANQVEFEQYTGLKDKNGKEIYEGDIIESWYLNGDGNGGYYDAGNFEVVFKNGAFGVTRKNDFYTFDEIEWDELEDIKVIGNIHENPELLEDQK